MSDLLIKGELVIDGTGVAGRPLDVRVHNGVITEMARDLGREGERLIDASGALVAPGFIDSHTHLDATIYWDPTCNPMPQHGVTSVVAGNCSLGLAPMHPKDRLGQVDVYSYIEDMPLDVLNASIPWSWETYGDYVRALSTRGLGVNLMAFVGHGQIRCYVMGGDAWKRTATPEEIATMALELEAALAAGALGLSFSLFDNDRQGRPVPSRLADDAELDALFAVLAAHGASFQFVPKADSLEMHIEQLERIGTLLARHHVLGFYNVMSDVDNDPEWSPRILASLEALHKKGARMYGMASPRPFELAIRFEQSICFTGITAWNELVQATVEEKRRMVADPQWRARARADADTCPSVMVPFAHPHLLRIGSVSSPDLQSWRGRTLGDLVEARGGHVADVLADWVAENDFDTTFVFPVANGKADKVAGLLKSPVCFVSASDAGAHLMMFCAAGDATLLLTRYVRERGDMSVEAAVHALTGRQAELLGIAGRGVLAPGNAGDITIFALDELHYGPEEMVTDLPCDRSRLTRAPGGYRYTIVNGVVVQENGSATGALPAGWLPRGG